MAKEDAQSPVTAVLVELDIQEEVVVDTLSVSPGTGVAVPADGLQTHSLEDVNNATGGGNESHHPLSHGEDAEHEVSNAAVGVLAQRRVDYHYLYVILLNTMYFGLIFVGIPVGVIFCYIKKDRSQIKENYQRMYDDDDVMDMGSDVLCTNPGIGQAPPGSVLAIASPEEAQQNASSHIHQTPHSPTNQINPTCEEVAQVLYLSLL